MQKNWVVTTDRRTIESIQKAITLEMKLDNIPIG